MSAAPSRARLQGAGSMIGLLAVLGLMILVFSLWADNFFTQSGFLSILRQIPAALIVSVGMTFVLIVGGIDLSVGSVLAFSSAALAVCMTKTGLPMPVAVLVGLVLGLLCGVVNGTTVVKWRLPSFIVTLGMLEAARGGTYLVTQSDAPYIGTRIEWLADLSVLGLSMPFLVAAGVVVAGHVVLTRTIHGRHLVAMGNSDEAARLCGIRTGRLRLAVFAACGGLTGLAGVIETARMGGMDPNMGVGFELEAIAAVVIGGTSLSGGRGSVLRSAIGVVIIAVLVYGLASVGAKEHTKRLVTGLVIVAAVIIDQYRQRSN